MTTTFTPEQVEALSAKLDAGHVKQREQAGRKLSYIEGWHAIAEANRIFGFDSWARETVDIRVVSEGPRKIGRAPNQRDGFAVTYIARVRVTVGDIVREGVGSGHGIDADLGLAHESAIKEAETDAMKRALMTFGNPFGLALYDKSQENVDRGEPEQRRAAPRQQDAAPPSRPPADDFWERPSYAIRGNGPEDFGKKLCEALRDAPTQAAMTKVWEDNETHIKALPEEIYQGCSGYMGKRMAYWSQHPTGRAA